MAIWGLKVLKYEIIIEPSNRCSIIKLINERRRYSAATEDGSEPEEDEWLKKKRQENTWNYMVVEENPRKIDTQDITLRTLQKINEETKKIVAYSIDGLNNFSNNITAAGLMLGIPASVVNPKFGVTTIGVANTLSTIADFSALGISGLALLATGQQSETNTFQVQFVNTTKGMIVGGVLKGLGKIAAETKAILKAFEQFPELVPIPRFGY